MSDMPYPTSIPTTIDVILDGLTEENYWQSLRELADLHGDRGEYKKERALRWLVERERIPCECECGSDGFGWLDGYMDQRFPRFSLPSLIVRAVDRYNGEPCTILPDQIRGFLAVCERHLDQLT